VGDRRIRRRLRTGLGLFTIAIDIFVFVQAESTKLDGSPLDLVTVTRHADRFQLVKNTLARELRSAGRRAISGLGSGRSKSACGGTGGLVLLLGCGNGSCGGAGSLTPRIPRVGSFAGSGFGLWGMGDVGDLFEVCFCELILGRYQCDFGNNSGGGHNGDGRRNGSRLLDGYWRRLRCRLFADNGLFFGLLGFLDGFGGDGREGFDDRLFGFRCGSFLRLGSRLRCGGLSQHAGPGLGRRGGIDRLGSGNRCSRSSDGGGGLGGSGRSLPGRGRLTPARCFFGSGLHVVPLR